MAATPITSARSRRTANAFIRPSTSSCRICQRRSRKQSRDSAFAVRRSVAPMPVAQEFPHCRRRPPPATSPVRGRFGSALCSTDKTWSRNLVRGVLVDHALAWNASIRRTVPSGRPTLFCRIPSRNSLSSRLPPPRSRMKRGGSKLRSARSDGDAHQSRFFFAGDDFQIEFWPDGECVRSARGRCGLRARRWWPRRDRRITPCRSMSLRNSRNAAVGVAQSLAVKFSGGKCGVAQAHRGANRFDDLPFVAGADSRDN